MNPNDYDEDGNNIVPCPICLSEYCPSKEDDGKCPEEDEFVKAMEEKKMKNCQMCGADLPPGHRHQKMPEQSWLIWSNEHDAWWGPNRRGYVSKKKDAGVYSFATAQEICVRANQYLPEDAKPYELMVPLYPQKKNE